MITLRKISPTDAEPERQFLLSFPPEENGFERPGDDVDLANLENFKTFIQQKLEREQGINLPADRVPDTMFWILKDNQLAGVGKVRHYLNDTLRAHGGHIGIGIHPNFRSQHVGSAALPLLIDYAKSLGEEKILITNDATNLPSRRITEKAGGVLDRIENNASFYWIS